MYNKLIRAVACYPGTCIVRMALSITYYGRNLNHLTNQYTFNVDNPWVIAIC
jgi:hypothetical protein